MLRLQHQCSTVSGAGALRSPCLRAAAPQRVARVVRRAEAKEGEPGPGPESEGRLREFSAYTSVDEWKKLDSKVNKYPSTRVFNAIGATDDPASFTKDMVAAVESVVGPVHSECVSSRPSSGGKYTAVRVQAMVQNGDQVVDIFAKIKEVGGSRLKWYM